MPLELADWSSRSIELSQLLSRSAVGDRDAFESLYKMTSAHLFGIVLRICKERSLAEEALQESFIKVWHAASSFDAQRGQPMTWLMSVARNQAIDGLRRRAGEPAADAVASNIEGNQQMLDDLADGALGPLERLRQSSEAHALADCIDLLAPKHRQCLALAFYNGMSHSEVSDSMGEPLGTIKSWVRRALAALKSCIEAGDDHSPASRKAP